MIRYSLLLLFVSFLCVYAWRDWYKSLCGLVAMMAVLERYDMPRAMFGIVGMNPWNITMLFVLTAFVFSMRKEKLDWKLSGLLNFLLAVYLLAILVAVGRTLLNSGLVLELLGGPSDTFPLGFGLIADSVLNSLKYVIPGILFYMGCNSENRFWWGASAILVATFLLGLQVIRWMPWSAITDADTLQKAAIRLLDRNIGYHRIDLAAITASTSWTFFVFSRIIEDKRLRILLLGCGVVSTFALALSAGRAGYLTWLVLGFVVAVLHYRRYLFAAPVLLFIIISTVPAARDRLLEGIVETGPDAGFYTESQGMDLEKMTSDRTLVWPVVIDKILERPIAGYGRYGFILSGARRDIVDIHGPEADFPHPHNAYLEFLMDTGVIGALPVFVLFYIVVVRSFRLMKIKTEPVVMCAGVLGFSFVLGQLIASIGAQSFYPRAGVVMMWCAIGLVLRVSDQLNASSNRVTDAVRLSGARA